MADQVKLSTPSVGNSGAMKRVISKSFGNSHANFLNEGGSKDEGSSEKTDRMQAMKRRSAKPV